MLWGYCLEHQGVGLRKCMCAKLRNLWVFKKCCLSQHQSQSMSLQQKFENHVRSTNSTMWESAHETIERRTQIRCNLLQFCLSAIHFWLKQSNRDATQDHLHLFCPSVRRGTTERVGDAGLISSVSLDAVNSTYSIYSLSCTPQNWFSSLFSFLFILVLHFRVRNVGACKDLFHTFTSGKNNAHHLRRMPASTGLASDPARWRAPSSARPLVVCDCLLTHVAVLQSISDLLRFVR